MDGYEQALRIAKAEFVTRDFEQIARDSGAIFDSTLHELSLVYLNRNYRIDCATGIAAVAEDSTEAIPTTVNALLLHYLLNSKPASLTGRLISFRDVKGGGRNYFPTFEKRAIFPLLKMFGEQPELLSKSGASLGGEPKTLGDASIKINVLPRIPVIYSVCEGDEEMPASANILFDENISLLLPCEDVVLAASFGVYELMKQAQIIKKGLNSK